jgi:hypothetical protein
MGRVPIPKPGFLDRCTYLGYREGNRVWRDGDGSLYTWDGLHGEVEMFNSRGEHLAALDAVTGRRINPPRKGRRIRV